MISTSPPWLTVIIPIKDERDNLSTLTERLVKVLDTAPASQGRSFEILYIDDGSTDGSSEYLDNLAGQFPSVRVLHFDRNYGQTAAFDAGFRHAGGELIATLDGDLQLDPEDLLKLLPLIVHYDVVCGWRKERQDTLVRKISSRLAFVIRSSVTGDRIHDTGCSLKLFRRAVVERLQLFEGLHRFFPSLVLMHGFTITEVPVRHYPRLHGRSKYGIGNRLFRSLYDLIAVRWMQRRCLRYRIVDPSSARRAS